VSVDINVANDAIFLFLSFVYNFVFEFADILYHNSWMQLILHKYWHTRNLTDGIMFIFSVPRIRGSRNSLSPLAWAQ
jgi:hypothetical protein